VHSSAAWTKACNLRIESTGMRKYMTFDLFGLILCALGAAEFAWSLLHTEDEDGETDD
jgi:hypothetical protein